MMFLLILRITMENGQFGHKILARGTRGYCEEQAWFTDINGVRGPGIVKAEMIVIDRDVWRKIQALQVRRRG